MTKFKWCKGKRKETQTICVFTDLLWCAEVIGSGIESHWKNGNHMTFRGMCLIKVSHSEGVVWKTDLTARWPERLGDQGGWLSQTPSDCTRRSGTHNQDAWNLNWKSGTWRPNYLPNKEEQSGYLYNMVQLIIIREQWVYTDETNNAAMIRIYTNAMRVVQQ